MTSANRRSTLLSTVMPTPTTAVRGGLRTAALVVAGVAFLALLAQIRLQIGVVPVTGQTLGVLLLGAAYGARLGAMTSGAYLLFGVAGMPLFTGGQAGFAYLMGPTGGYLVGFVVAATLLGALAERGWDRSMRLTAVAMLVASLVIYAFGLTWLHFAVGGSWLRAIELGMLPFVAGDLIKLGLATVLLPTAWRLLGKR